MINNNSGNKNKNITFYRSMYTFYWPFLSLIQVNVYFLLTFFIINTSQCIFFLILIQVNVYFLLIFLSLIHANVYFFNTNTGECIFFLILIQVNVYFLLIFFIINPVLVLKIYIELTCINDKKINKKYTLTCIIVVLYVRLTGQYFLL